MPRKSKILQASGRTILLVDDNPEYLNATRILLEREGHRIICAANGSEALDLLRKKPGVDLLLLDYFMPGMTGEEVVSQLRQFNPYVQVILQTGYASEQPPRDLLRRLDIQGYYDKSEGPEKLLLWVDVGLKAAYAFQLINKSRQGLRFILDVTPDLHKIRPLEELLQGILWQVSGLLGVVNSFLAVLPYENIVQQEPERPANGFLAIVEENSDLIIRAGTGRFVGMSTVNSCLESDKIQTIQTALQCGKTQYLADRVIMPLCVGQLTLGIIYLDQSVHLEQDMELLHIFANQAAVAIQNAQLYEMATMDPLTGAYVRRFLQQCLLRELRSAFRSRQPLSLLMIDVDGMKAINDTAGHLAGDQALATIGGVLRRAIRATDSLGRFGGDEFVIILPKTSVEATDVVVKRIFEGLSTSTFEAPNGVHPLRCSIGVCELNGSSAAEVQMPVPMPQDFFRSAARTLLRTADNSLYRAKRAGGNQMIRATILEWGSIPLEDPGTENPDQEDRDDADGWQR